MKKLAILFLALCLFSCQPDTENNSDKFQVKTIKEEITGALDGFGCYQRRDEAIKNVFPDFDPDKDKFKIVSFKPLI